MWGYRLNTARMVIPPQFVRMFEPSSWGAFDPFTLNPDAEVFVDPSWTAPVKQQVRMKDSLCFVEYKWVDSVQEQLQRGLRSLVFNPATRS